MSVSLLGLGKEALIDALVPLIQSHPIDDVMSAIDAYEDPITMGAALNAVVRRLYREFKDVTNMIAVGDLGVAYCLRKAAIESDEGRIREIKKFGQIIAFNSAVNCWPGWADPGVVIAEEHVRAGIKIAVQCRDLAQELALTPRERGGDHWLVGALELAAGGLDAARVAFEQAEQVFLTDDATSSYALMARGYLALARKADPRYSQEGANTLSEVIKRLRGEGSKDAIFFADQLATADRVLIGK